MSLRVDNSNKGHAACTWQVTPMKTVTLQFRSAHPAISQLRPNLTLHASN